MRLSGDEAIHLDGTPLCPTGLVVSATCPALAIVTIRPFRRRHCLQAVSFSISIGYGLK